MVSAILASLAARLEAAGIPYMVIGGQAVLLYGEPRLTRDVDVALGVEAEALPRLLAIAAHAGWRVSSAIARARTIAFEGQPVRFASPEDLVVHKIVAGRPRDIEDAVGIARKQPALDTAAIERDLAEFEPLLDRPLRLQGRGMLAEARPREGPTH